MASKQDKFYGVGLMELLIPAQRDWDKFVQEHPEEAGKIVAEEFWRRMAERED